MELKFGTLKLEGCELEYSDQGDGPIVLALHGHLSDKQVWEPCSEIFSNNGYRFVSYTQRYYGSSSWSDNGANFTRETHVLDLLNVVRKLDLGPVHLMTRSYGGNIGLRAAIEHPDYFLSMVHFEPALADPCKSHPEYAKASLMMQKFEPVMQALAAGNESDAAMRFIEIVYQIGEGEGDRVLPSEAVEMIRLHGRVVKPYFDLPDSKEVTKNQLACLLVPTMLMHGSESFRWFTLVVEVLAELIPGSSKYIMPGVSHDGVSVNPTEFSEVSLAFIRSVNS